MSTTEIRKTERRIQQEIIRACRNRFCLKHHSPRWAIMSIPNEGRDMKEQLAKIAMGLMSGAADILFLMPGRTVFMEVKVPGPQGRQSPEQIEFQQTVEALGFEYYVVRSLDDVYDLVIPDHKPVV